jgi:hypothetical protein
MRDMTQAERMRCAAGVCPGCGAADCKFTVGPKAHGGENVISECGRRFNFSPSIHDRDGAPVMAQIDSDGSTYTRDHFGCWPLLYWRSERREDSDRWGHNVRSYYSFGFHVFDREFT